MAPPVDASSQRTAAEFTLGFVLAALVRQGLLTVEQSQDVHTQEAAARARVVKSLGLAGQEASRYDVSPIEVVAAFQVPVPGGRGDVLDEDRVSEAVARAAGVAYRKIDPL